MAVISLMDRIEEKRHEAWWYKVTTNILQVMNVFKEECSDICAMIHAHGDKDNLESGSIYSGVDEYFCEEPIFISAKDNNLHSDIEGIAPGKYVIVLQVTEDEDGFKYGKLTYMKKRVGEPL